jgi:peptidoglycan-N-acetylglucosamine deacetylase
LAIIFIFIKINFAFAMEIAITIDDLPANGDLPADMTRMAVVKKMLEVFKKHHITGVYGFINGYKLNEVPDGLNILEEWVNAGHYLGNHTYHHIDLAKTSVSEYIADIQKNEPILSQLTHNTNYRYFRYPFLAEGNTQDKRDGIRQFLFEHDYKAAPVTTDFFEYEWNDSYVRCLSKHDEKSIAWLKKSYLEQSSNALIISHELSQLLFNRDIKNILLIHINAMSADMLDDLLTSYEKQQVKFISLSDALNDDVYQINPNVVRERSYTFLNQILISKGLKNPDIVEKLYNSLPEDQLDKICR